MKRCEWTKVEITKDRVDHKPSPIRARSVFSFLLGNPSLFYFSNYGALNSYSIIVCHVGRL